jgi:signal transduction histidine kinase
MERLLDDLLEFARIRPLRGAEDDLASGSQIMSEVMGLINVPPGFVLEVSAALAGLALPRLPMQRVLGNLVNNAIQHHDRAQGRVNIDLEETPTSYVFRVRDDGPGIPVEHHERIFEMFSTLKARDVKDTTGMGLAMVRKTLRQHGSDIVVESGAGRGATFRFEWPKRLDASPAPRVAA